MDYVKRAKTVFDIEIDALRRTRARLDAGVAAAVGAIVEALRYRGKVIVTGVGNIPATIAHKISATFTSTGTTSVVLDAVNALHGDSALSRWRCRPGDEFSGETRNCCEYCLRSSDLT